MNRKATKENKHAGWRTTTVERVSYYIGENAKSLEGALVQTFMTTFLLLSGVNLVAVATVTLIVKIFDAFDDLVFGFLLDKLKPSQIKFLTKIGGQGRYLPWYRALFWVFPLVTVLLFQMPQGASDWVKVAYFGVFYLLYDLSYTLIDVPMSAAIMTITDHPEERNTIVTNKNIITAVMTIIAAPLMLFLISEKVGMSIKSVVIMMSVVLVVMMLPLAFKTKEHNASAMVEKEEKYTLRDMFFNVKGNKYLLLMLGAATIYNCFLTGNAVGLFVSYYLYGDSTILLIPMLIMMVPALIAQKVTEKLCKKHEKIRVALIIQAVYLVLRIAIFVIGYDNMVLHIVLLVLQGIPSIMYLMATQYMTMDCIEYGQYKSGKECAGITFALRSFIAKVTPSIASSLGLLILGAFGWISIQAESFAEIAEQNIVQPASAITGLWIVHTGPIIIGTALSILFLLFYRLKSKDAEIMGRVNRGEISHEEAKQLLSRPY